MAKKWTASSQQLKADPKYNSKLVAKFINCMIQDGKKSIAQRIFYDAMDIIKSQIANGKLKIEDKGQKTEGKSSVVRPPSSELEVFETAVNNVKPLLEVRSRRIGGASYQVPMQVGPKRQQSLAFRWIIQSARSKKGKPMCSVLADELIDAYNGHGGAMTTRENIHRMAEANKAFAHFAW
ncbi:MAG: 30S ribosomal protein S7 [Sedimentisphaerales bacterium]